MKSIAEQWVKVNKQLNELKQEELKLRQQLTPQILGDKDSGSKTAIIDGY